MALIVCKHCGKNISDTVDTCIHCGAGIYEESAKDFEQEEKKEQEREEKPIDYFDSCNNEKRYALEKEFLTSDNWAKKYRRTAFEVWSFGTAFIPCVLVMYIIWRLIFFFDDSLKNAELINPELEKVAIISLIALAVLVFLMLIYSIVITICLKVTRAKYRYMKKFQKWLMEEKNITYNPPFNQTRHKKIFDRINI